MTDEYISPEELFRQLGTAAPLTIIDVRGADEYAAGHLPGAWHIPGDELAARLDDIPRVGLVVPY